MFVVWDIGLCSIGGFGSSTRYQKGFKYHFRVSDTVMGTGYYNGYLYGYWISLWVL